MALEVKECQRCQFSNSLRLPGMGKERPRIAMVTLAPSKSWCRAGSHFRTSKGTISKEGRFLDAALRRALGVSISEVYMTSVLKCSLPRKKERVSSEEASICSRYFLERELSVLPRGSLIVALGNDVARLMRIPSFRRVGKDRGKVALRIEGSIIMPTYHPSYALRFSKGAQVEEDLKKAKAFLGFEPAASPPPSGG